MAGYCGYSMSNNAVAAYDSGLLPASKIKGIPATLIKEFCRHAEWHHSSKMYNVVEFYDPAYVRAVFGLKPSDEHEVSQSAVAALAAHKARARCGTVHENCVVEWLEWGGTRKHPKAAERTESGCRVTVKGQTASVTLPSGRTLTKRLNTRGFRFRCIHENHSRIA